MCKINKPFEFILRRKLFFPQAPESLVYWACGEIFKVFSMKYFC